ncbi:hypothetical protein, partial [Saccharopolyspora elongata]
MPTLMDDLPQGVDVRGVLDATVMRPYTEGLLGVEALVVGWPGAGLSIRAWHVSGVDVVFERFPPGLGVDARFSFYSVLVVDSQGQRRAPVLPGFDWVPGGLDEVALPVRSRYAGPSENFFVGARDRSSDGADSGSGRGGSVAGTGDSSFIADGGRPDLTAATVPPGMVAPVEGGAGFGGAAKQAVTAAVTVGGSREPDTMPGTGQGQGAKPHDKPTPGGQSAVVWSLEGLSVAASRFEEAEQRRWKDQPRDVQSREVGNLDDARARVRATYEGLIDAPGRDRERVFLAALRRGERHDALVTIAAHLMSGSPEALSVMPDLQVGARDSAEVLLRALARNLLQQPSEAGHDNPAGTTQVSASSVGSAASGRPPVREQSLAPDLLGEIDRLSQQVGWASKDDEDAAR